MMAGGAGAIAAAGVIEPDAIVQRDVQQRFLFAVILVGQLAVLELNRLALGKERDLHRVLARSFNVAVPAPDFSLLPFALLISTFLTTETDANDLLYSNSALATGCGAFGPSPMSA